MITKLKVELQDPQYSGMTDAEVASALNAETLTEQRGTLTTGEIFNAIDPSEYSSLNTNNKNTLNVLLSLGQVDIGAGTNARTVLLNLFPGGSQTRNSLIGVAEQATSRAKQIGINRTVEDYHVAEARS